jgi:hypothetical protein
MRRAMGVYMCLMMRVYMLLMMRISSVMGMGMPISSMVVTHMVVPTINSMSSIITSLSVV